MNRFFKGSFLLVLVLAGIPAAVQAAANATVEAVQSPAWVERGTTRIPIAPGMQLQDRDQVRTGASAKLLLRTPDGSAVKLGENARFNIDRQEMRRGNVYTAAMGVAEGAFRLTTDVFAKFRGKRDVEVKLITITTGIRGTDLWGKSASDREIVCLIEGRIAVQRGTEAPVALNEPLSFYIAPAGAPALPVAPVPPEQLKEWAAETEIAAGRGAARRGGRWVVILAAVETQAEVLALYDAVRGAGYAARILPVGADKKTIYELRLAHLPSQAEAQVLANALQGKYGITVPKVSR